MKYAVIQTGGKQYRVAEGETVTVERLPLETNAEFICKEVLLVNDEGNILIGTPFVADMLVKGTLVSHIKGPKIRVSKFKSKVRYRRVTGHRQSLSQIKISAIGNSASKKAEKPAEQATTEAKSVRKTVKKEPK